MLWKLQRLHLLPVSLGGLIQRLGLCWALLRSLSRDDPCQAVPARVGVQHSPSPHSQLSRTGMGGRAATGAPAVTSTRQLWCLRPALYWGRPHISDPSSLLPAPGMLIFNTNLELSVPGGWGCGTDDRQWDTAQQHTCKMLIYQVLNESFSETLELTLQCALNSCSWLFRFSFMATSARRLCNMLNLKIQ